MSDTNCPHCKETHNVWESCKTELCREREAHNQTKRERDEARAALMKIEDVFVDGEDTYEDWRTMGNIARAALEEEAAK